MYIWYWTQDVDPAFMVSIYTPAQIEGWNDCLWTDPSYTKLSSQQAQTIDEAKRIPIVQQAEQIFYQASPYIIFSYPAQLEAWNSAKWTGWTKAPAGDGAAIYNYNNIDTYKNLTANAGATSSGTPVTLWIALAVIAVIVVIGAVVLLRRRGRGQAVEA